MNLQLDDTRHLNPVGREKSTRDHILIVALELFATKGFGATSIREVAEKVGITKSSIYGHFANKEQILESLMENCGPGAFNAAFEQQWLPPDLKSKSLPQALLEVFQQLLSQWINPLDNKALKILIIEQFNNVSVRKKLTEALFVNERSNFVKLFDFYLKDKIEKEITAEEYADDLISFVVWLRCEHFIFSDTTPDLGALDEKIRRKIHRTCKLIELA